MVAAAETKAHPPRAVKVARATQGNPESGAAAVPRFPRLGKHVTVLLIHRCATSLCLPWKARYRAQPLALTLGEAPRVQKQRPEEEAEQAENWAAPLGSATPLLLPLREQEAGEATKQTKAAIPRAAARETTQLLHPAKEAGAAEADQSPGRAEIPAGVANLQHLRAPAPAKQEKVVEEAVVAEAKNRLLTSRSLGFTPGNPRVELDEDKSLHNHVTTLIPSSQTALPLQVRQLSSWLLLRYGTTKIFCVYGQRASEPELRPVTSTGPAYSA